VAGFGGLPYLGWFIARSVCLLSAAILVVNGGVVHLMTLHSGPRAVAAYFPQFIFLVMFTGLMAIGSLLTHARLLRSLPVSRLTLAGLIVFFPFGLSLVSALAGVGLLRVTGGIRPEPERILLWMLIQIPYVFVAPLALRFGFRMSVLASMIAFATASMGVSSYFIEKVNFESAPTLAVAIGLAVTMVPLAWMLTHLALGTSHPWKSGALRMPFQPRRV
ncbi:MAG: hypothetical protein KDM91_11985, partial [Verrucomicrobiae bacterium]|nr:hypothetical protein [Verrucomicrobiae bacterium]